METIVTYFETIPSSHRSLLLVGGITLFWLLETAVPLITANYGKWKHAGVNIFFTFTTILVNFVLAFILIGASAWVAETGFGLLQWTAASPWVMILVGLPLFDLIGAYFAHWCEHRIPFLWRFHLIHHTDQHVDVTTANRHHPGESVIRFTFTTAAVLLLGAPVWLVFLYQSLSVVLSQFTHANIVLPTWLDRILSPVFVTPDMHRVHHHYELPYTDSNYGNIFSFWDRLFGTHSVLDNHEIVFGVDTHMGERDHGHIGHMLGIPFRKKDLQE